MHRVTKWRLWTCINKFCTCDSWLCLLKTVDKINGRFAAVGFAFLWPSNLEDLEGLVTGARGGIGGRLDQGVYTRLYNCRWVSLRLSSKCSLWAECSPSPSLKLGLLTCFSPWSMCGYHVSRGLKCAVELGLAPWELLTSTMGRLYLLLLEPGPRMRPVEQSPWSTCSLSRAAPAEDQWV